MSHWNHRLVKQILPSGDFYSIREVFYNDDKTIFAYTENPVEISGGSIEEIRQYLQWCLDCLDNPVLVDSEVVFVDNEKSDDFENSESFDNMDDFISSLPNK